MTVFYATYVVSLVIKRETPSLFNSGSSPSRLRLDYEKCRFTTKPFFGVRPFSVGSIHRVSFGPVTIVREEKGRHGSIAMARLT